jgi:hypothetical protein
MENSLSQIKTSIESMANRVEQVKIEHKGRKIK